MPEDADATAGPVKLGAILLAAGGSSRMGAVKQLLEVGGKPMVARAVDAALGSGARPVVVVLGANAEAVGAAIADRPVIAARNAQWEEGMASSLRTGLAAASRRRPVPGRGPAGAVRPAGPLGGRDPAPRLAPPGDGTPRPRAITAATVPPPSSAATTLAPSWRSGATRAPAGCLIRMSERVAAIDLP